MILYPDKDRSTDVNSVPRWSKVNWSHGRVLFQPLEFYSFKKMLNNIQNKKKVKLQLQFYSF